MLTEETLKILVPLITAMLGIFIGYYLNQALYERKRKDELADRDFTRRAAIHDRRMQEAREYIEKFNTLIGLSKEFMRTIGEVSTFNGVEDNLKYFEDQYLKYPSIANEIARQRSSIDILIDEKLTNLRNELYSKVIPNFEKWLPLIDNMSSTLTDEDFGEIKKGVDFEEAKAAMEEAEMLITKMKARLDKLAQEVP